MLGGYEIVKVNDDVPGFINTFSALSVHDWAGLMFILGAAAFGFLNAVLAGFIAYAIADRPASFPASSPVSLPAPSVRASWAPSSAA